MSWALAGEAGESGKRLMIVRVRFQVTGRNAHRSKIHFPQLPTANGEVRPYSIRLSHDGNISRCCGTWRRAWTQVARIWVALCIIESETVPGRHTLIWRLGYGRYWRLAPRQPWVEKRRMPSLYLCSTPLHPSASIAPFESNRVGAYVFEICQLHTVSNSTSLFGYRNRDLGHWSRILLIRLIKCVHIMRIWTYITLKADIYTLKRLLLINKAFNWGW